MSESRAMNVAEEGAAGASPAIAERLAAPSGGAQSVADTNGGAQSVARTWRHLLKRPPSGWRSSIAWNHFRSLKKIYYVAYDGAKSVENARVLESRPDAGACKKKTVVCLHCSAKATTREELVHSGYSFTGTTQMFQHLSAAHGDLAAVRDAMRERRATISGSRRILLRGRTEFSQLTSREVDTLRDACVSFWIDSRTRLPLAFFEDPAWKSFLETFVGAPRVVTAKTLKSRLECRSSKHKRKGETATTGVNGRKKK